MDIDRWTPFGMLEEFVQRSEIQDNELIMRLTKQIGVLCGTTIARNFRRKMAGHFSAQISNRTTYPGFRKVSLCDYKILGNEIVPYFEFDNL